MVDSPFYRVDRNGLRRVHRTVVYFAQVVPDGLIKIGYSKNPCARFSSLTGDMGKLVVGRAILDGSLREEQILHRHFAHLRQRGEWFKPAPELLNFIEKIRRYDTFDDVEAAGLICNRR